MRICVIGKFPPIQGGVSARTYWTAHRLAARGHEVHVVTNAKEASAPFRMHMRRKDWKRCEAVYEPSQPNGPSGSVTVHWTDPVDRSQFYIPMASAFVSKLATLATNVHSERPFDVIYSHYLEPYGVAGHLAAEIVRVPHVVRMAGSDAGRLWRHPQFEALYDHVLRSARILIASGAVASRAMKRGVRPERIVAGGSFDLPEDLFRPEGLPLDLAGLRQEVELDNPELRAEFWGSFAGDLPFFGIYGKLGETKGSFALLSAMQRLKKAGVGVGLVVMAHGWPALENRFRARAKELGIVDRVLQIPFLPHWRVPEFLRSCLAVCCLEQDFPIVFHAPIVAREVLTCGRCLVGSTEVIRKLPDYERLPDGYGCVAIEDVRDVDALSERLGAITRDPGLIPSVAARGRAFARTIHFSTDERLEKLLKAAARGRSPPRSKTEADEVNPEAGSLCFPITQSATRALGLFPGLPIDLPQAREALAAAEARLHGGDSSFRAIAGAIRLEIAIAEAENSTDLTTTGGRRSAMFRLRAKRWAIADDDLSRLVPTRDPHLRLMTVDVSDLIDDAADAERPPAPFHCRHVVAFARVDGDRKDPLFVSDQAARILELSDGTRTALEIVEELDPSGPELGLRLVENLFASGLLWLEENRANQPATAHAEKERSAARSL